MSCRHVLFIEEAHNVIGQVAEAKASEENADPKAHATEFMCRMLAECRGFGEGVVIIDQLPSAVSAAVIKHAGSKLVLRETHAEDREIIGGAMLFGETEMEDIARLETGAAYFFTEGYHGPRRIQTVNIHDEVDFDKDVTDERLRTIIRTEPWFREMAGHRIAVELAQLEEAMDAFDERRVTLLRELKRIVVARHRLMTHGDSADRGRRLGPLFAQARSVKRKLHDSFKHFKRRVYRRYMPAEAKLDPDVQGTRDRLARRFGSVIEPDVQALSVFVDKLIENFTDPQCTEIGYEKAQ